MDTILPLDRCLHPTKVIEADGVHFYPCGHCLACKKAYHTRWRQRLIHELQTPNTYPLFITLTYSNEHLPLVSIDPSTNEIKSISYTKFGSGSDWNKFRRLKCSEYFYNRFGRQWYYLSDHDYTKDFPHYVVSRVNDNIIYDKTYTFGICLRKDVQDFIKRLRSGLSRNPSFKYNDTSFTYFICSEYGPQTHRPHYHGILFFRNYEVAQYCNDTFIARCWRKSDKCSNSEREPISKPITFSKGVASYVSKYVTCDTPLPSILDNPLFRPFHLQSNSTPIGSNALSYSDIFDKVQKGDILYHSKFYVKKSCEFVSVDLPYPSSVWSRVFPRFLFEQSLSDSTLLLLFRRIFDFVAYDGSPRPIPNLVSELNEKYGIGKIVNNSEKITHRVRKYDYFCEFLNYPTYEDFYYHYGYLFGCSRVTYADVFFRLVDDSNFIDYYLFGIPHNRTAVLKIIQAALNCPECYPNSEIYFDLFKRFRSLHFSTTLRSHINRLLLLDIIDIKRFTNRNK